MKIYVAHNADGFVTGFYVDTVHGPRRLLIPDPAFDGDGPAPLIDGGPNPNTKIPPEAVEITEEQYQELLDNPGARKVSVGADGVVSVGLYTPPPPTPAELALQADAQARRTLRDVDLASIRGLREYVAAQSTASEELKTLETQATAERTKLRSR